MGGACSTYEERRGAYRLWWGDLKETSLGRPRRRLEDNIKMDLPKVE